jgi:hypothetical protein
MPSLAAAPDPESPHQELAVPASTDIRTSDREREEVVERLHHALGEGRLDLEETDARVAAAYAARYRGELTPLLTDLPDGPGGGALTWTAALGGSAPTWTALWDSAVWRARVVVLGAPAHAAPTAAQRHCATWLALIALAWFVICAVIGAAMVAA